MSETPGQELDTLLEEARQLLGEEAPAASAPSGHVPRADEIHIDYEKFYGEVPAAPAPTVSPDAPTQVIPPLTAYEQSRPAYQTARRALHEQQREQARQARERRQQARSAQEEAAMEQLEQKHRHRRAATGADAPMDSRAYADWLYAQGADEQTRTQRAQLAAMGEEAQPAPPRKGRKRWLLALPALLVALCLVLVLAAKQPKAATGGLGDRVRGSTTILLAGTDAGGYRTDTMMLLSISRSDRSMRLVSIPRDTLVYCAYSVPKINSAYGWGGGGDAGMEELLCRVSEIIGFRPDGYLLIDLDVFEQLVDCMGGVEFDVPMQMYYTDPTQDLTIDLAAGMQKLTGAQAMQLVRFRAGYADADLGRVCVQRDFVDAALSQWSSPLHLLRAPKALRLLESSVQSDLTAANYLWLAESVLLCRGNVYSQTLPGAATYIAGGSYYVLNAQDVADLVNDTCNPYQKGVSTAELSIRTG